MRVLLLIFLVLSGVADGEAIHVFAKETRSDVIGRNIDETVHIGFDINERSLGWLPELTSLSYEVARSIPIYNNGAFIGSYRETYITLSRKRVKRVQKFGQRLIIGFDLLSPLRKAIYDLKTKEVNLVPRFFRGSRGAVPFRKL